MVEATGQSHKAAAATGGDEESKQAETGPKHAALADEGQEGVGLI